MVQIKSHTRTRKNGVTTVRKHMRKKVVEHPSGKKQKSGPFSISVKVKPSTALKIANKHLQEGTMTPEMHNRVIRAGFKLHRGKTGNKYTK